MGFSSPSYFSQCFRKAEGLTPNEYRRQVRQGQRPAPVSYTHLIKVAAIETGYGADMWKKVAEAFTAQTGIKAVSYTHLAFIFRKFAFPEGAEHL